MKQVNLKDYLVKKEISIDDFVIITGVSRSTIYRIIANPNWSTSLDNIRMIYQGTLDKYGTGLDVWEYLNR